MCGLYLRDSVHHHHGGTWQHAERYGAREGAEKSTPLIHRQQQMSCVTGYSSSIEDLKDPPPRMAHFLQQGYTA